MPGMRGRGQVKPQGVHDVCKHEWSQWRLAAVAEVAGRPWPEGTDIRVLTVVHATAPLVLDPAFVLAAIHVEQTKEQLRHAPDIGLDSAAFHNEITGTF